MKKALVISIILIAVGVCLFLVTGIICGFDFSKLGAVKYETKEYYLEDDFNNVVINVETEDIYFELSHDDKIKVESFQHEGDELSVKVLNGTLYVEKELEKKIALNIDTKPRTITVYLPKSKIETINIKSTTGDIKIPEIFAINKLDIDETTGDINIKANSLGNLNIKISTGDIVISNALCGDININASTSDIILEEVECSNFTTNGTTGSVRFSGVEISSKLSVHRSTGDIIFDSCDAGEIDIETTTGDICGLLLSPKSFDVKTTTGSVNVPKDSSGGICKLKTSTGDIMITVK